MCLLAGLSLTIVPQSVAERSLSRRRVFKTCGRAEQLRACTSTVLLLSFQTFSIARAGEMPTTDLIGDKEDSTNADDDEDDMC